MQINNNVSILKSQLTKRVGTELNLTVNESYSSKVPKYKNYTGKLIYASTNTLGLEVPLGATGTFVKSFTYNEIISGKVQINNMEEDRD